MDSNVTGSIERIDRNIYFCSSIEEATTKELIKSIVDINIYDAQQEKTVVGYKREPIKLFMTTGGGSVVHAIALFDLV